MCIHIGDLGLQSHPKNFMCVLFCQWCGVRMCVWRKGRAVVYAFVCVNVIYWGCVCGRGVGEEFSIMFIY